MHLTGLNLTDTGYELGIGYATVRAYRESDDKMRVETLFRILADLEKRGIVMTLQLNKKLKTFKLVKG